MSLGERIKEQRKISGLSQEKVAEIIGHINDPGTDILSIVMDFGIETEFPEKALNQAKAEQGMDLDAAFARISERI